LEEAMVRWASRPEDWPAMGKAGRDHVAQFHDARRAIHSLEALYANLLK
jgi:hypothetical protein